MAGCALCSKTYLRSKGPGRARIPLCYFPEFREIRWRNPVAKARQSIRTSEAPQACGRTRSTCRSGEGWRMILAYKVEGKSWISTGYFPSSAPFCPAFARRRGWRRERIRVGAWGRPHWGAAGLAGRLAHYIKVAPFHLWSCLGTVPTALAQFRGSAPCEARHGHGRCTAASRIHR